MERKLDSKAETMTNVPVDIWVRRTSKAETVTNVLVDIWVNHYGQINRSSDYARVCVIPNCVLYKFVGTLLHDPPPNAPISKTTHTPQPPNANISVD